MVGDSQIGKTSLMVKYVEGSFDEDYIQTLGEYVLLLTSHFLTVMTRRQLYGENNIRSTNNDYVLNLGFGWSARVCEYVASGVQRCRGYLVHVRLVEKEYIEFGEGMVQTSAGFQQSTFYHERYVFPHLLECCYMSDQRGLIAIRV